ncbi:YjbQ family protein [Candidatus Woesearchaeota archaeon]|nr:MAG: YjbQ family protein [Candidatus Woesearchaeota archaeon]
MKATYQTSKPQQMIDITSDARRAVRESGVKEGICAVYTPHATAAIIINENHDPYVCDDIFTALNKAIPEKGDYLHDRIDNNAAAHIKASILGPSETVPIVHGNLALGTWQRIMLVELDGPRRHRDVLFTVIATESHPDTHS